MTGRRTLKFTGVHGTWHRNAPWLTPGSPFLQFLAERHVEPLCPDDPFRWSGDVNGWQFWRRWGWGSKDGDRRDWLASGDALRYYLRPHAYRDRGCLLHSHGLWAGIGAAAGGLEIPWIVSIGSPCREDMEDLIRAALPNLGAWLHIFDHGRDPWGRRGGHGDGRISLDRAQRFAGVANAPGKLTYYHRMRPSAGGNDPIRGIDHSKVLTDPAHFHLWETRGWLEFMAGPNAVATGAGV